MDLPRIYFDTNDGDPEWGYELKFSQSKKDIEAIGADIHDGIRVVIYMTDELEMEAELKFEHELGYWKAIPDLSTIRYLDGNSPD